MKPKEIDNILKESEEQEELFAIAKKNITSIEELHYKQQNLIAAYSIRFEKKEEEIDSLKIKTEEFEKLTTRNNEILVKKESEINLLKNTITEKDETITNLNKKIESQNGEIRQSNESVESLNNEIEALKKSIDVDNIQIEELKNEIISKDQTVNQQKIIINEKEKRIQEIEKDSKEYNIQLSKQKKFFDSKRNREKQVCDQLVESFKTVISLIQTKKFNESPFSKIGFNDDNLQNIINSLEKTKNEELNFWNYLEYNFSEGLFNLLKANNIIISKIFRLYLYSLTDKILQDLKNVLDVDLYCKSVKTIQELFAFEGIHIQHPALLFDKYRSDLYELEKYNIINQINGNYTNSVEYNLIIDLELIGIKYKNHKINPTISKKN